MNANRENPTLKRLEEQIDWYDNKSTFNQSCFKRLKIIELVAAALIPLLAGLSTLIPYPAAIITITTGSLGALIVVLESLQGLYQFQSNWISYRSTCEGLRHEKYLWLAKAGPYAEAKDSDRLLAERIESLISTEHAKWVSTQEKAGNKEINSRKIMKT
jgi:hypothetical protein